MKAICVSIAVGETSELDFASFRGLFMLTQVCVDSYMMCLNPMLHFAFVIALALRVRAQDVYYITSTLTECFPVASASDILSPDFAQRPANPTIESTPEIDEVEPSNPANLPISSANSDNSEKPQPFGVVSYSMPPCAICDCPTCTTTSVFTTTLPDFGSNGLTEWPYTVTETYVGMSSLPYFPTPTPIPYGFTTAVETCTDCGSQPITRTLVAPNTGRPWGQDVPEATGDPEILPTVASPPKSGANLLPGISEATDGRGFQPSGAHPAESGQNLPTWVITASNNVEAVETTLSTSTERIAGKTQFGGQEPEGSDSETRTWGPSAVPTSYVEVSAAELFWRECLTSYCFIAFTFWVVVLFQ